VNRIGDFALIGDCHSAALVGRDGRIEWACFPRFDSPAVFCAVLDERLGGSWSVTARGTVSTERAYVPGTNVLVTTFHAPTGTLEVTDCMPIERSDLRQAQHVVHHASIMRRIACTTGEVEVEVELAPRFEYGSFLPRFRITSECTADIIGGADALYVHATRPLVVADGAIVARWTLAAGEVVWLDCVWRPSYELKRQTVGTEEHAAEGERRLAATIAFWRGWLERCRYDGVYRDQVLRSALALKAMTYAPSGAIVAAPTTSFPEEIGGNRNWDYRYTWIRDATLTLTSLFVLGFFDEADAFKLWLERTGAGRPADLQIMYGIGGERWLPELELPHLAGHRGSAAVRIGNGAVKQLQLDAYGQLLEAAYLYGKAGGELTDSNWRFLAGLVDIVCNRWQKPDQGIWEIRDEPRHFTHSKANCWLALAGSRSRRRVACRTIARAGSRSAIASTRTCSARPRRRAGSSRRPVTRSPMPPRCSCRPTGSCRPLIRSRSRRSPSCAARSNTTGSCIATCRRTACPATRELSCCARSGWSIAWRTPARSTRRASCSRS
jgi:GH15 family glucan-1,4-alpha-glucosidase